MSLKLTGAIGAALGLAVCAGILSLMWFGVSGVLYLGHTDLTYVLWPSSVVLVGGWKTTAPGITITVYPVLTNFLIYAGIAILLRWGTMSAPKRVASHSQSDL